MQDKTELDVSGILPMERETLQARVYRELRNLLMVGRFLPGQMLKIRDLAQVFGTSVQPVREAIRQLIAERALEAAPNSSARVPRLSPEQLEDLQRARVAIEGLTAELAAQRATSEDVKQLTAIVNAEEHADEQRLVEASVSRNLDFHFRLYALSGSKELVSIIEGLWLRAGPLIRDVAEGFDASEGKGATHHVGIVRAMARRDGARARKAVEQDIGRFFELAQKRPSAPATKETRATRTVQAAGSPIAVDRPRQPGPGRKPARPDALPATGKAPR